MQTIVTMPWRTTHVKGRANTAGTLLNMLLSGSWRAWPGRLCRVRRSRRQAGAPPILIQRPVITVALVSIGSAAPVAGQPVAEASAFALPVIDESAPVSVEKWGPHSAPGKGAQALGQVRESNLDTKTRPPLGTVRISGKVTDLTLSKSRCGWAVFSIAYRVAKGRPSSTSKHFRTCTYAVPKFFTFSHANVDRVSLKLCSEAKAAEPYALCLYGGAGKVIYASG
jgi:hypothetical protein